MNRLEKLTKEQQAQIENDMRAYFHANLSEPGSPEEKSLKSVVKHYMSDNYLDKLELTDAMKVEDIFTQSLAKEMTSLMLKEAGTNAYEQGSPGYVERTKVRDYCFNQFGKLSNEMNVGLFEQAARDFFKKSFEMFPTWHEAYEPITENTSLAQHAKRIGQEYTKNALNSPVREEMYRTMIEKISEGMDGNVRSWHTETMQKQFESYYLKPFTPVEHPWNKNSIMKKIGEITGLNRTWEQPSENDNKNKLDK
jgi:hypothetical protein